CRERSRRGILPRGTPCVHADRRSDRERSRRGGCGTALHSRAGVCRRRRGARARRALRVAPLLFREPRMLNAAITIVSFLVTVGVLVVIHEYGHFWVARRLGVKILRF